MKFNFKYLTINKNNLYINEETHAHIYNFTYT